MMARLQAFRILILLLLTLAGCSSLPPGNPEIRELLTHEVGALDEDLAGRIMKEKPHRKSAAQARIEGEIKRDVWKWIRYYSVIDRARFIRALERAETYRPMVQGALEEARLPRELVYLALIESSYVNHATSPTRAVGIWQFMEPTARRYGLQVSELRDDRRHPVAATFAAVRYLGWLRSRFQSWYLAIAAYNAGEGRIERAIRRGRTRDFWQLTERRLLPRETKEYLPKFLAAATIAAHLRDFGFEETRPAHAWPALMSLKVRSPESIAWVARRLGLAEEDLRRFNPSLGIRPFFGRSSLQIRVPLEIAVRYLSENGDQPQSI